MEFITTIKVAQDAIIAREVADAALDKRAEVLLADGWGTRSFFDDLTFRRLSRDLDLATARAIDYQKLPGVRGLSETEILAVKS
jgi:hypothetical protein